jgi:hypothetical protein
MTASYPKIKIANFITAMEETIFIIQATLGIVVLVPSSEIGVGQ